MGFKWPAKDQPSTKKKTAAVGTGGLTLGFILARVFTTWRNSGKG